MRKIALILLILKGSLSFGQVELPFFEQIAFNFYNDSLLTKFPVKKKIRIPKYTMDFHYHSYKFQVSECLTGKRLTEGEELKLFDKYTLGQIDFDSPTHTMNYDNIDKKQFRIKKTKENSFPNLRISRPFHKKTDLDNFYIIITENYERKTISYYLLTNKNGVVKNWCKSKSDKIIVY